MKMTSTLSPATNIAGCSIFVGAPNAPARLTRYPRAVLAESSYRPQVGDSGGITEGRLSFRQTFPLRHTVTAIPDGVQRWSTVMVSLTCTACLRKQVVVALLGSR